MIGWTSRLISGDPGEKRGRASGLEGDRDQCYVSPGGCGKNGKFQPRSSEMHGRSDSPFLIPLL